GEKEVWKGRWDEANDDFERGYEASNGRRHTLWQTVWWMSGPYSDDIDEVLPLETNPDPRRVPDADDPATWWAAELIDPERIPIGGLGSASYYLVKHIWTPRAREVAIQLEIAAPARLIVNHETVSISPTSDSQTTFTHLKVGWNTVLLKVRNVTGEESVARCAIIGNKKAIEQLRIQ
ncbi:MAG: hypothetical protein AAF492_05395, partial [Verrucomicrobiota bacterium]